MQRWRTSPVILSSLKCMNCLSTSCHLLLLIRCHVTLTGDDVTTGEGRWCVTDGDCDGRSGETCWIEYQGCPRGRCVCDRKTHTPAGRGDDDDDGWCMPIRRKSESCNSSVDRCEEGLACAEGRCTCPHHNLTKPCIPTHFKQLGNVCIPSSDVCFHASVYSDIALNEVECSTNRNRRHANQSLYATCQCKDGYKQDGLTCRRLDIWERGCRRDFHCEGGSVCLDGVCSCPTGYKSVARNSKCARIGAILELPLRSRCDEINEKSYCSHGLVCHSCHGNQQPQQHFICAKYTPRMSEHRAHHMRSTQVKTSFQNITIIIVTVIGHVFQLLR